VLGWVSGAHRNKKRLNAGVRPLNKRLTNRGPLYCSSGGLPRMDKDYLTLKRASESRPSGKWNEDDYDVLVDGVVVLKTPTYWRAPLRRSKISAGNSRKA